MSTKPLAKNQSHFLPRSGLARLIQILHGDGYTVLGPTRVDRTICFREIQSVDDLPRGIRDQHGNGSYHLTQEEDELLFEFVVGPEGAKRYLFPPWQDLMKFSVGKDRFELQEGPPQVPKLALLGIRPCELAAIEVHDRVFGYDDPATFRCESEPWYLQVRQQSLYIAVDCTRPGANCFCASWQTGPDARTGFDLALTELREGFVLRLGTERGRRLAERLPLRTPTGAELELAELKLRRATERMGKQLDTRDVKRLLDQNIEHPEWAKVGQRCLACGNCTMVCPTCFCSTVTDATDLEDGSVTRTRSWESCFTLQFSYTVGGAGRESIPGRYRHWLRHKVCTWWDQFGVSGCVGCGRCITWCPVGIDLTEEIARIRDAQTVTDHGPPKYAAITPPEPKP